MPRFDVPSLLGENAPSVARIRRTVRARQLAQLCLSAGDRGAIRNQIESKVNKAMALHHELSKNPKNEQLLRTCKAFVAEATFLASDDEGKHLIWFRNWCIKVSRISKPTPLLPLALKTFGPYDYSGDAEARRRSDKQVSRDYKSIRYHLSHGVMPAELNSIWGQRGQGVDASSRPKSKSGANSNSNRIKRLSLTAEQKTHRKYKYFVSQSVKSKAIALLEMERGGKMTGLVSDADIVEKAIAYIRNLVEAKKQIKQTPAPN